MSKRMLIFACINIITADKMQCNITIRQQHKGYKAISNYYKLKIYTTANRNKFQNCTLLENIIL